MSDKTSIWAELKRRNVYRVGLFYLVAAWLVVQAAETVLPLFEVPDGVRRGLILLLALGLVPALVFAWIFELTPDGIKRESEVEVQPAVREHTAGKLNWATLIAAVLAIGLLISDRMMPEPAISTPAATTPAAADTKAVDAGTDAAIAVLPFADMSPDGDQEYFSDGVSEEILNVLAGVKGLDVVSRTSSFQFKRRELGIPAIAEALRARHIVEGSVRKAGETLRITAQLIDTQTDSHLWSDTFDRPLTAENIFAIQDEIATAIVDALVESLGIEGLGDVAVDAPTDNLTAYDLFLKARALFQAREALDVADELLTRSLDQDARFAEAWELRAALQFLMKEYSYADLPDEELERRGIEFAEKALAIEPESATAIAALANIRARAVEDLRAVHNIADIIRDFNRALAIEPRNASALNWLGLKLGHVGDIEAALEIFRRCVEYEPFYAPCIENEYDALLALNRHEEAFEHYQAALKTGLMTSQYVNFSLLARFDQKTAFMLASNQSLWLSGWRRHEEIYDAYQEPNGDHRALVEDILRFVAEEKNDELGYLANLLIPIGAHDLLPFPVLFWGDGYARYRQSPQFKAYIRKSGVHDYWREVAFPPQCRPVGNDDFACD
jgi:TolB-like protein/Tfp pilus assembly protein PilF